MTSKKTKRKTSLKKTTNKKPVSKQGPRQASQAEATETTDTKSGTGRVPVVGIGAWAGCVQKVLQRDADRQRIGVCADSAP